MKPSDWVLLALSDDWTPLLNVVLWAHKHGRDPHRVQYGLGRAKDRGAVESRKNDSEWRRKPREEATEEDSECTTCG